MSCSSLTWVPHRYHCYLLRVAFHMNANSIYLLSDLQFPNDIFYENFRNITLTRIWIVRSIPLDECWLYVSCMYGFKYCINNFRPTFTLVLSFRENFIYEMETKRNTSVLLFNKERCQHFFFSLACFVVFWAPSHLSLWGQHCKNR